MGIGGDTRDTKALNKENRVDAAVVLGVVGDLGVL
jgi:hypothetical protein